MPGLGCLRDVGEEPRDPRETTLDLAGPHEPVRDSSWLSEPSPGFAEPSKHLLMMGNEKIQGSRCFPNPPVCILALFSPYWEPPAQSLMCMDFFFFFNLNFLLK